MKKIITIDGLASSGKSTLSKLLAKKLNWAWFSTGVLYRGMAYIGIKENLTKKEDYLHLFKSKDWHIKLNKDRSLFFYKGKNIHLELYKEEIDHKASLFSAQMVFRKALIPIQRGFYPHPSKKGLILEGRDCGTIIFPSAPLKVFLVAGEHLRAKRRAKDRNQPYGLTLQSQKKRDGRDQNRFFAPLIKPKNALCLDSSHTTKKNLTKIVYQEAKKIFF